MNRAEAIKILSSYDVNGVWADVDGKPYNAEEQAEAFDMAIEALQKPPISQRSMYQAGYRQAQEDRPRGEWIHTPNGIDRDFVWWVCSECGHKIFSETEKDRIEFHAYCGRCGADMRGEDK